MFPKSQSSSSQFALVEDVLKDAIRKIVVSAEKEKINGGQAAYALFKEALSIPGFSEERIVELFSPILNVEQLGDFSFYSYNFHSSLEISFFAKFLRDGATVGDEKLMLSLFNSVPKGSQRVFFRRLFVEISRDGPLESVDKFFEMAKHLNKENVKEWLNAPTDLLVEYCSDSPYVSIDNIQKIIALGVDTDGLSIAYRLVYNNRFLDFQGTDGLLRCLEPFIEAPIYKGIASWLNTPSGKKYVESEDVRWMNTPYHGSEQLGSEESRKISLLLVLNFCSKNFQERIIDNADLNSFIDVCLDYCFSVKRFAAKQRLDMSSLPDYSGLYDVSCILESIKMNHKLHISSELMRRVLHLILHSCNPGNGDEKNNEIFNKLLVAIQNCDDIKDVEDQFLDDKKTRMPETVDQFLSLPVEEQQWLLNGFVLFRDRKGLQLVSELLKHASGGRVAAPVLKSALTLLKKTQILHDPDADETHLLNLIFSLWISTSGNDHREMEHVLGEAVLALSELDFARLKSQYRSGIFEIFKTLVSNGRADPTVLNAFIHALGLYSYDASKIEDREILDFLIPLMKRESTPGEMKFSLAKVLSTIKYEPALLSAWNVIKGPLWDRYAQHDEGEERR